MLRPTFMTSKDEVNAREEIVRTELKNFPNSEDLLSIIKLITEEINLLHENWNTTGSNPYYITKLKEGAEELLDIVISAEKLIEILKQTPLEDTTCTHHHYDSYQ